MTLVSSWGRLVAWPHEVVPLTDVTHVAAQISGHVQKGLAYGMGRSYGDVCLNPRGLLWQTTGLDHFISFDDTTGELSCEAGVLLRDIQRMAVPRGWMLAVTPGTQLVTVGGAVANDVHGKNHHAAGSFGDHILSLRLLRTSGEIIECGPDQHPDWFTATVGGMGLTGVITRVVLQLRRVPGPWVATETIPYSSLDEFFLLADSSEAQWEHTVSWIDCLSGGTRGIFMRGSPAEVDAGPIPKAKQCGIPFVPPVSLVNGMSLRPFNAAYYNLQRRKSGAGIAHYESFFYPLDNLHDWNRMYGPKGFFQYQSVVPRNVGPTAIKAMLDAIARSGQGSFLAVLKTFGHRAAPGMLSFPQPGVTLALDFPNKGAATHRLFERLDAIVGEAAGRLYPAKDARMPRALFEMGYPRLHKFSQFRDPGISSSLSRRLMGH